MLNDAVDEATQNMMNSQSELEMSQSEEARKLDQSIDKLTQSTRAAMRSEQDKVEGEVDDKAGEVENKVTEGTAAIDGQVQDIEGMGTTLGGEIRRIKDELTGIQTELTDASHRLIGTKDSSGKSIENIKTAAETAFGSLVGSVETKKAETLTKLNKEVTDAKEKALADQGSIEADLEQKINGIRDQAETKLSKSASAIHTATERGETIAKEMVATGESIKTLKETIEADLPATKQEIEASIKSMKSQLQQVKDSFEAAKTSARGTVDEQNSDMMETFETKIDEFQTRIDDELRAATTALDRDVETQGGDIKSFKDSSAETYSTIKDTLTKAQAYLRETYVKVAKTVNGAETGSVKQNAEMKRLKNSLLTAMNSLPRDAASQVAEAKSELQTSARKAKDEMAKESDSPFGLP
jgi:hypothetical protein